MKRKLRKIACGHIESSCQTGLGSQNQISQRKHHIQFSSLLLQTSVPCFPVSKPTLDHGENVLDFCPNGGFFALTALDLSLRTNGNVFCLGRTAINFVPDLFAAVVLQHGLLPLFSAQVTAVAILCKTKIGANNAYMSHILS